MEKHTEETCLTNPPCPDTLTNALIYLRTQTPVITGEDLDRLTTLHHYALEAGYTISEVWPVYDPYNGADLPRQWYTARQDLAEGRFDVIVLWHEDRNTPDTVIRDDMAL